MKYSIWILVAFLALGCQQQVEQTNHAAQAPKADAAAEAEVTGSVIDVPVDKAYELIQQNSGQPDFVVLDVRTPREYAAGHLPGAQMLNFFDPDFQQKLGQLDRDKTYLVYCRSGNRSGKVVPMMEKMGFKKVYHLFQGYMGWSAKGMPVEK